MTFFNIYYTSTDFNVRRIFGSITIYRRSLSFAAGVVRSTRIFEGIQAIKIRFSDTTKRANEAFLPRARTSHLCPSFSFSLSPFFSWRWAPSCWPDAAANKKGREVIEKVEQPRSLACTCRGACRLYRRARPRDGHEHLNMYSRGIYLYLPWQSNISRSLRFLSSIVFQSANL